MAPVLAKWLENQRGRKRSDEGIKLLKHHNKPRHFREGYAAHILCCAHDFPARGGTTIACARSAGQRRTTRCACATAANESQNTSDVRIGVPELSRQPRPWRPDDIPYHRNMHDVPPNDCNGKAFDHELVGVFRDWAANPMGTRL